MSNVPDAWEDEWSSVADTSQTLPEHGEPKKPSSKVTKAQRRAQHVEFNKQLWAEAEGPKETNFFLESRNAVPLRSEFKPPPILLSRKGPITKTARPPTDGVNRLNIGGHESSEDEDEAKAKELTLAERQAQAARDREEKQRKYEERRQELFGPAATNTAVTGSSAAASVPVSRSGNSSPASLTPPSSRSATPNRGRGRGGRRGGVGVGSGNSQQPRSQQQRELFDPTYTPKPDSVFLQRRENGVRTPRSDEIQPIRVPKVPDGSGRGFASAGTRGGKQAATTDVLTPPLESSSTTTTTT